MKYSHFTYRQNDYAILKFDFPAQLTFLPDVTSFFVGWSRYTKSARRRRVFSPAPGWLFSCICVLTRQNKASRWNMLTLFSLVFFFWCFLITREDTYAMSFIPISFLTLKRRRPEKNKYVIYRVRSVRMGKNCVLGREYGPRPRGVLKTKGPVFSQSFN